MCRFYASVVAEGWCEVSRVDSMVAPCLAVRGFDMYHDFCVDGGHGSPVEREHSFHCFVSGEKWIGRAGEHVERDVGSLEIFAPVG